MTPDTIFDLERQHNARYPQATGRNRTGQMGQRNLIAWVGQSFTKLGNHLMDLIQKIQVNSGKFVLGR